MSVRARAGLVVAGVAVLAVLWFLFLWKPGQDRINELRAGQDRARAEQAQLRAQLERLRDLQRQEPRLRAEQARLQDALPTDPRLPDIILQIQDAATKAGIDFLSIAPSLPAAFTPPAAPGAPAATPPPAGPGQLQAITLSVTTTGRYFEILDFIVRVERLRRAVRINNITMAPGGTAQATAGSPLLNVTFSMQMFLTAPAAAPAPSPTPTPTPAPGPAPSPTPGPTPAPGG